MQELKKNWNVEIQESKNIGKDTSTIVGKQKCRKIERLKVKQQKKRIFFKCRNLEIQKNRNVEIQESRNKGKQKCRKVEK